MNTYAMRPAYPYRKVFIVDGSRTPFLKASGRPGSLTSSDLALAAARPLMMRQPFEPDALDEVILGCVMPRADEANIARLVSLRLGCGDAVPAWTVQRNCASAMQALDSAATHISIGRSDLVLAGGCEAMSHAPVLFRPEMVTWLSDWQKARSIKQKLAALSTLRPKLFAPVFGLAKGLTDATVNLSMGETAEVLAYHFDIQREAMDQFALSSHQKLAHAVDKGYLPEIEPIINRNGFIFEQDNGLRKESSLVQLAKLRAVFDQSGSVTAGNSAQLTDGAACVLLASQDAIDYYHLPILGEIVDSHWSGLDPAKMGLGPVYASTALLQRHQLGLGDIDFWEINEAFASQVLACLTAWEDDTFCQDELNLDAAFGSLDPRCLNVDGGAIALGHPVGATGARLVLHLLHVLKRHDAKLGVATLCIGGGQGGAMLISREGATS